MSEEKEFEAEVEALGMVLVKNEDMLGEFFLNMEVDLDTEVDYSHLVGNLTMKKLTKRKDYFYISIKGYNKLRKTLTLSVQTPVSEKIFDYYQATESILEKTIGTNFPDLCWYFAEGTTELTKDETDTEFREDCEMGDLTWYLPARMVDNFIEIMHTLNQSFLEGLMQHTICYGPFPKAK